MAKQRALIDYFFLVLKGMTMGVANKVPGVSGGIIAFVSGFYEEFMYSLKRINSTAFKLLLTGRFKSFFTYTNSAFLGALSLGMIISYFSASKLLDYFIVRHELYVWSLFFGLIIGSIFYIFKRFSIWHLQSFLFLIIGILTGIAINFLSIAHENSNLWFVFFCGFISVCGMTLPGLSGSFILILLGNYVLLLVDAVNALYNTLSDIIHFDFTFIQNHNRLNLLLILAIFTLGSIVGLVIFSHMLTYILKHYKNRTLALIMGFITGSLGIVWPWKKTIFKTLNGTFILDSNGNKIIENYKRFIPQLEDSTYYALCFIALGFMVVVAISWYERKLNSK